MKKTVTAMITVLLAILLCGCAALFGTDTENTKIDLGASEIYTSSELQNAADHILAEFRSWESVEEVYTLTYCGDEKAADNLEYCNQLNEKEYDQCVVFESAFLTSGSAESEGFEANSRYDGWEWYLARANGGEWEILTCGYA